MGASGHPPPLARPTVRLGIGGSLDWLRRRARGPGFDHATRGRTTTSSGSSDAPSPAPVPRDGSTAARLLRGGGVGLASAALVVLARQQGVLDGAVGLTAGAILALAIPTSRLVSRRILLTGCLVLGWVPVLWWWDLPVGSLGRVTLLLALGAGSLTGWAFAGPRPTSRLRAFWPRFGWADLLPAAALVIGAVMLSPWLRLRSGESALSVLLTGWDHSAHYDMTAMIREHGAVVWSIAGPGGDAWSYATYPQGYHALTAAVMELGGSASAGSSAQEVLAYGRSLGLVSLVAVTVVVAGIAALPMARRRPLVAAIAAGVVTAAFHWGPAGLVLADGFPNFYLACALLAAVPLVAVPMARWPLPLPLAALAGALVGIAHSWALLLTMALPMALVILLPWRSQRAAVSRGRWVTSGVVAVATLAAAFAAILVIRVQPLADIVVLGATDSRLSVVELVGVVGACAAAVLLLVWRVGRPWPPEVTRTVWVVVGPAVGAAFAAWIAAVQLRQGSLGYYFWKYAIALELVALVIGSVAATTVIARTRSLGDAPLRVVGLAACSLVVVAVGFGAPHPAVPDALGLRDSRGLVARSRLASVSGGTTPEAERLLEAAAATRVRAEPSVYLPIDTQSPHSPASVSQWHAALSGQWTDALNAPMGMLVDQDMSAAGAPALVRQILLAHPDVTVLVPPSVAQDVRAGIGELLSRQVQTW